MFISRETYHRRRRYRCRCKGEHEGAIMATIELVQSTPANDTVVENKPSKGEYSVKVVSRGRKGGKRTAQVIVTPGDGGRPFTRHLIEQPKLGFTDQGGRAYALPKSA